MRKRRTVARFSVIAAGLFAAAGLAVAASGEPDGAIAVDDGARDAQQHGTSAGHLNPQGSSANVALVSKLKLKNVVPEKIADVGVFKGYAYLASWGVVTCKYNGVHVVDVRDPANPKEAAFIASKEGSYPGEGIQALHIDTPAFNGDVLVSNNEKCKDPAGFGGMNIYDVSKPSSPTPLVEGVGDSTVPGQGKKDANEIHSVFAWDAGDKAYAVIVDNEEGADVDIIDITDPKKASLIAEYDLDQKFPQILQSAPANLVEVFFHDVVVKAIGGRQVMLLSYWDAGYVSIDVTDPLNPTYIGDTDFTNPDPEAAESGFIVAPEGNGHEAEFTNDNQYIVGADEDFGPFTTGEFRITSGPNAGVYPSGIVPGAAAPGILPDKKLNGPTVYGGYGCPDSAPIPSPASIPGYLASLVPGEEKIVVLQRGPAGDPSAPEAACFPGEKAHQAVLAGWDAVLFVQRHGGTENPPFCGSGAFVEVVVGVCTNHEAYHKLFNTAVNLTTYPDGPAIGTVGAKILVDSIFDGWGYVHLFRYGSGKMAELGTYAIPEAHDPAFASGFGDLSVHEAATSPTRADLVYFSYYAAGFRVAKIVAGDLVEAGHYIDVGGNNFWGVQVFQSGGNEYVAASDRDFGLYIFRYTGS